jgi:hypothetical protein
MWNGNAVAVRTFFLAVFIGSIAGCDGGVAPPQAAKSATDPARSQPPELRYQVDPARKRVWFLSRDGVFVYEVGTPHKVVVPLPDWLWVGTHHSCLPDLALGPKGEAVITSNILPTLWRIDPETLAVSVHPLALDADTEKDVGFSALVYSPTHQAFFAVSDLHGSLWRIDPQFRKAEKIMLSAPIPETCGLTLQLRVAQRKTVRPVGLCARAPRADWAVDFSPDQRSAYVSTAWCTDRLAQLDALSLTGE